MGVAIPEEKGCAKAFSCLRSRHFEGTAYMCGAAYLLSAGFAARVLNHDEIHRLA